MDDRLTDREHAITRQCHIAENLRAVSNQQGIGTGDVTGHQRVIHLDTRIGVGEAHTAVHRRTRQADAHPLTIESKITVDAAVSSRYTALLQGDTVLSRDAALVGESQIALRNFKGVTRRNAAGISRHITRRRSDGARGRDAATLGGDAAVNGRISVKSRRPGGDTTAGDRDAATIRRTHRTRRCHITRGRGNTAALGSHIRAGRNTRSLNGAACGCHRSGRSRDSTCGCDRATRAGRHIARGRGNRSLRADGAVRGAHTRACGDATGGRADAAAVSCHRAGCCGDRTRSRDAATRAGCHITRVCGNGRRRTDSTARGAHARACCDAAGGRADAAAVGRQRAVGRDVRAGDRRATGGQDVFIRFQAAGDRQQGFTRHMEIFLQLSQALVAGHVHEGVATDFQVGNTVQSLHRHGAAVFKGDPRNRRDHAVVVGTILQDQAGDGRTRRLEDRAVSVQSQRLNRRISIHRHAGLVVDRQVGHMCITCQCQRIVSIERQTIQGDILCAVRERRRTRVRQREAGTGDGTRQAQVGIHQLQTRSGDRQVHTVPGLMLCRQSSATIFTDDDILRQHLRVITAVHQGLDGDRTLLSRQDVLRILRRRSYRADRDIAGDCGQRIAAAIHSAIHRNVSLGGGQHIRAGQRARFDIAVRRQRVAGSHSSGDINGTAGRQRVARAGNGCGCDITGHSIQRIAIARDGARNADIRLRVQVIAVVAEVAGDADGICLHRHLTARDARGNGDGTAGRQLQAGVCAGVGHRTGHRDIVRRSNRAVRAGDSVLSGHAARRGSNRAAVGNAHRAAGGDAAAADAATVGRHRAGGRGDRTLSRDGSVCAGCHITRVCGNGARRADRAVRGAHTRARGDAAGGRADAAAVSRQRATGRDAAAADAAALRGTHCARRCHITRGRSDAAARSAHRAGDRGDGTLCGDAAALTGRHITRGRGDGARRADGTTTRGTHTRVGHDASAADAATLGCTHRARPCHRAGGRGNSSLRGNGAAVGAHGAIARGDVTRSRDAATRAGCHITRGRGDGARRADSTARGAHTRVGGDAAGGRADAAGVSRQRATGRDVRAGDRRAVGGQDVFIRCQAAGDRQQGFTRHLEIFLQLSQALVAGHVHEGIATDFQVGNTVQILHGHGAATLERNTVNISNNGIEMRPVEKVQHTNRRLRSLEHSTVTIQGQGPDIGAAGHRHAGFVVNRQGAGHEGIARQRQVIGTAQCQVFQLDILGAVGERRRTCVRQREAGTGDSAGEAQ